MRVSPTTSATTDMAHDPTLLGMRSLITIPLVLLRLTEHNTRFAASGARALRVRLPTKCCAILWPLGNRSGVTHIGL